MCNDAVLCVSLPQRLSLLLRAAPNWALLTSFCSVNGCQTYLSFLSTVFWEEEGFWEGTEQMAPRLSLQVMSHATPSGGSLPPEEVGEHFFEYCCSRDVQLVCVWLLLGFLWRWKGWLLQSYHDIVNKHHPSFLLGALQYERQCEDLCFPNVSAGFAGTSNNRHNFIKGCLTSRAGAAICIALHSSFVCACWSQCHENDLEMFFCL